MSFGDHAGKTTYVENLKTTEYMPNRESERESHGIHTGKPPEITKNDRTD